jgi:hypothetical protein
MSISAAHALLNGFRPSAVVASGIVYIRRKTTVVPVA